MTNRATDGLAGWLVAMRRAVTIADTLDGSAGIPGVGPMTNVARTGAFPPPHRALVRLTRISAIMRARRLTALITAPILALASLVVTAQPSHAVSCVDTGCTGKDPQSAGCSSGASTLAYREWGWNGVGVQYSYQLKYSSSCRAYWGRFVRDDCDPSYPKIQGYWLKVRQELWTPYGWYKENEYYKDIRQGGIDCDSIRWTLMIGRKASSRYTACYLRYDYGARPNPANVPHSSWSCLGWFYS